MNAHLQAVLERRIQRLNNECAVARQRGLCTAPFVRRARQLTDAWRVVRVDA